MNRIQKYLILILTFNIHFLALASDSLVYFSMEGAILYSSSKKISPTWPDIELHLKKNGTKPGKGCVAQYNGSFWKFFNPTGWLIVDSIADISKAEERAFLIRKNHALGLISFQGKLLAKPIHTEIKYESGFWQTKEQNIITIKDKKQNKIRTYRYEYFFPFDNGFAVYGVDGQKGIINMATDVRTTEPVYDEVQKFNDTLFLVRKKENVGLLNREGEIVVPVDFQGIEKDESDYMRLKRVRGKTVTWGMSNYRGRIVIPPLYDEIAAITSGLFPVKKNNLWGYFDTNGQKIIEFFYDSYGSFVSSGLAAVKKSGQYGIIDKKGTWVAFPEYDAVQYVNDTVWIWRRGDLSGFYSVPKRMGIPYMYSWLQTTNGGFVLFKQSGKYGLLSASREVILKPDWEKITVFEKERIIIAMKDDFYSIFYFNGNLKVFMNYPFSRFDPYKEGMAMVVHKNKYGFIDKDGLLLVSTQYDEARPFNSGIAAVRIGEKWGFVDSKEKFIVPPHYEEVQSFSIGAAIVKKSGKYGLVNKQGKEISKTIYSNITALSTGNFLLEWNGRFGIADNTGVETINPIYKDVYEIAPNIFKVRDFLKYFLVDINNNRISETDYDDIYYSPTTAQYIFIKKHTWKAIQP